MINARLKQLTIAAVIAAAALPGAHAFSDDTTRDLVATGSPIRPAPADPAITHALQQISPQQIQHTIGTLVGSHTRNICGMTSPEGKWRSFCTVECLNPDAYKDGIAIVSRA